MPIKNDEYDIRYLGTLYEDLSEANRRQEVTLKSLEKIAIETRTFLVSQGEKVEDNKTKIKEHDGRIRNVERKQDLCTAPNDISGIKKQLNRLIAFKDMILSKTNEDSGVLDVHALRMKKAVDDAMLNQIPFKILILKMLPWMIIVFVIGIVLATVITTQMFYNDNIVVPNPQIEIKTNSSSLVNKK
jgi:hypothetical protein